MPATKRKSSDSTTPYTNPYTESIKAYLEGLFKSKKPIEIQCEQRKSGTISVEIKENSEYPFIQFSLHPYCGLLEKNLMYIGGIHKSSSFSGNIIMNHLLNFARCFNYKKIKLDDASRIDSSDFKCEFSLAKFYLLSRNERWYSKFGFQRDDSVTTYETQVYPEEKMDLIGQGLSEDEKRDMMYSTVTEKHTADFNRKYERTQFEKINALTLNKFNFKDEDKDFIKTKLGKEYADKTVHELFDRLQDNRLEDSDICHIESIFKVLDEGIKDKDEISGRVTYYHTNLDVGGTPMILELPNDFLQKCYDTFKPIIEPFICKQTRKEYTVGLNSYSRRKIAGGKKHKKRKQKNKTKKRKNKTKKRKKKGHHASRRLSAR